MTDQAAAVAQHVQTDRPRYPVIQLMLLLILLAVATFMTWLLHSGTNYQEVYDLNLTHQASSSLYSLGSNDDPMPLYFWFLHTLQMHLNLSLDDLRSLSLIAFLVGVVMAYFVGYRATDDKRIGMLGAALIGLSPFLLWYGGRATVYAWLALLVLINQYFFTGLLNNRQWSWPGYIISVLLGVASHFIFLMVVACQLLFVLIKRRQLSRPTKYLMLAFALASSLLFVLWVRDSSNAATFWHYLPYTGKPSATNAFIIYVQYLFGFQSVVTTTLIIAFWPILVTLGLLAVQKYVRPPIGVQYFMFAAAMPVLLLLALGWIWKPLFLSSYLIICLPPFLLALSWYLVAFELRALAWARYGLIIVMIIMLLVEVINSSTAVSQDYLGQLSSGAINNIGYTTDI